MVLGKRVDPQNVLYTTVPAICRSRPAYTLSWRFLSTEHTRMSEPNRVVTPVEIASVLTDLWSPRVIAEVDDSYVKVAKVHGSLTWHSHDNEDELFLILRGTLRIEMEDRTVVLHEGQAFVVPKGMRHNPVADEECLIMLIERKSTLHTGTTVMEKTRSIAEQLAR